MIYNVINFLLYYTYIFGSTSSPFKSLAWTYVITYAVITVTTFVLKGVGIYALSKKNGVDKEYLGFVPFVSYYQLGRLIGPMSVFKTKVKNLGVIVGALILVTTVIDNTVDYFRYFDSLKTIIEQNSFEGVVTNTSMGAVINYNNYVANEVFYWINVVLSFAQFILYVFLLIAFFRFYAPRSSFLYAILSVFFDPLFGVFVFAVRKNKKGSYYQRHDYGVPYDGNYYGDPFRNQSNYYNNQNGQNRPNNNGFSATQNQNRPFENDKKPADDVFEEYSHNTAAPKSDENNNEFKAYKPQNNDDNDDLF